MKSKLAALLTLTTTIAMYEPPVADACGVKLTIKSGAPRRAVARTSNPSKVLLLGKPSRRLERDLTQAGHSVDVSETPTPKKDYAVVVADADRQNEARSNYPTAIILVRSSDPGADVRTVENQVGRKPVRTSDGAAVVAAREARVPVAVGGGKAAPKPVASGQNTPTKIESKPPEPEPVAVKQPDPKPEPVKPDPKPEPVAVKQPEPKPSVDAPAKVDPKPARQPAAVRSFANGEIYFGLNTASVGERNGQLQRAIKWLASDASVNVTIEGHADPSGNADANLALSQRRAEWVKEQLVAGGIDASRIEVVGFGDTKLKYGAADGRNRRVVIVPKN